MNTPIEDAIAEAEAFIARFKEFEVPEDSKVYTKWRAILAALKYQQEAEKQEPTG